MQLEPIFPQFDAELIKHLESIGQVAEFDEGAMMMRPGQYFKNSLLILDGRVKLYREGEDGEEFFLYYLEKGNACALSMICAAKNETSAIKAKAITPVKALTIPIQYMDGLMKDYRQWYYFVLESYRARFGELLEVIDQVQPVAAAGAGHILRQRDGAHRRMPADELHQVEHGAGRELQVLVDVEPERLAGRTYIDGDLPAHAALQRHGGHFGFAAGALHRHTL